MPKKLSAECFKIVNKNGEPVLFRTDDVTINKFTFTITNLTGEPLSLTGGTPVRLVKGIAAGNTPGSTFNFGFESMLTTEVVKDLKIVVPSGWAAAFFDAHEGEPASWSVAPVADTTIGVNEVIRLEIENIKCATTKPGNFEIMYRNIPGYPDILFPVPKHLTVLNPPDPGKATLPLTHGYINPVHPIQGQTVVLTEEPAIDIDEMIYPEAGEAVPVYITYDPGALIQNGFTLVVTNTSKDPLVPGNTADTDPPVVYISFLFGDEDYAITTQQLADNNISIDITAKLPWQPTAHTAGTAYWLFTPQSKQIMQAYESVFFPVKKIITALNVDPDTISTLYVQFNNIPGYNDASYTLQLQKKKAVAEITKLESDKYTINYGENIHLTWVSSLAKRVTITYETRDKEVILLDSAKGDIKLDGTGFLLPVAPSAEFTVIRAMAYDNSDQPHGKEITITVNQVEAAILSFMANPQLIMQQSPATDVQISWSTSNAKGLLLTTPEGQENVTGKTSVTKRITGPCTFTLEAWSYGTQFPVPVKSKFNIFGWSPLMPVPLPRTRDIEQLSPPAISNKKAGYVYTLNSVDNKIYVINTRTAGAEQILPGILMALSDDGSRLFTVVPNAGMHTVVMYDCSAGKAVQKASLYLPFTFARHIAISPDFTKLYCTGIALDNKGTWEEYILYINIDSVNNRLSMGTSIPLGTIWLEQENMVNDAADTSIVVGDPPTPYRGNLAFSGDGTTLYLLVREGIVFYSKIQTSGFGSFYTFWVSPVSSSAIVCAKTRNKLYMASRSDKVINVVDTKSNKLLTKIAASSDPLTIALSPDEQYLCIACFGSGQVIITATANDAIVATLNVGSKPAGMCFSNDGKILFVTDYCAKTLCLVDFVNRKVVSPVLTTGAASSNPYGIAAIDNGRDTRVYVTKESWPERTSCSAPGPNNNDDITAFMITKPEGLFDE